MNTILIIIPIFNNQSLKAYHIEILSILFHYLKYYLEYSSEAVHVPIWVWDFDGYSCSESYWWRKTCNNSFETLIDWQTIGTVWVNSILWIYNNLNTEIGYVSKRECFMYVKVIWINPESELLILSNNTSIRSWYNKT